MEKKEFYSLLNNDEYPLREMEKRSEEFYLEMKKRRTVRQFSDRPVPRIIIENCIRTAGTAPSGANMQPWSFIVVSDPEIKRQIHQEAEKVEREFYNQKTNLKWVEDLKPLGTNERPFLIMVVGYPDKDAVIPKIGKKSPKEIIKFV
ncbi:MAG: nitroreductase family protein [Candidatus Atribacteria bacterium]|nr:nitroreductase family protein [Candidatus Atribacteria bacterium]